MSAKISMDPFSSKNLLNIGSSRTSEDDTWHGFSLDSHLRSESLHLARLEEVAIPQLGTDIFKLRLECTPLEQSTIADPASEGTGIVRKLDEVNEDAHGDDIWNHAIILRPATEYGLLSWDSFEGHREWKLASRYLSEVEPEVYDGLWDQLWQAKRGQRLKFVGQDHFHHALTNLTIGRNSYLFRWNQETATFEVLVNNFSFTGLSPTFTQTLCGRLCECGTTFRHVQSFCESTRSSNSTSFALQSSAMQILHAIEEHSFDQQVAPKKPTILELVDYAAQYSELLSVVSELIDTATRVGDQTDCLTQCIKLIDNAWLSSVHLRLVLSNLATQILAPAVRATSEQLDLCTRLSERQQSATWLLSKLMPMCCDTFHETIECLTTIQEHCPVTAFIADGTAPVQIVHTWYELVNLQKAADDLEHTSRLKFSRVGGNPGGSSVITKASVEGRKPPTEDPFKPDFSLSRDQPGGLLVHQQVDSVKKIVRTWLRRENFGQSPELSPVQALDMSLSPFLAAQHRVSSYELMKMLFLQHNIVAHLGLLHSFQLLGNGLFTTRLSRALFDADENNAKGRGKTGLTAGLRLEDREVWPPASSELRLVLMGLLSESSSYEMPKDVLACMSFAIRDLSDQELRLCRDVQSTHALDFLRLIYAPSSAILELIVTPSILDKYDRIFKFLLVLLRMHALSQNLVAKLVCHQAIMRESSVAYHRFCVEFHHLVSTLLDFVLHDAIGLPWSRFMKHVKDVNNCLSNGRYEESMSLAGSIAQLRTMHQDCLDEMLKTLLLKKKEAKAYNGLCSILMLCLEFASTPTIETSSKRIEKLYKEFGRKVSSWLVQLSDVSKTSQDAPLQRIEVLLLKLDISNWYAHSVA